MIRQIANSLLAAGILIGVASAGGSALAKACRDASGKVVNCPRALATIGDHCVNLKTGERTKCGGPEAVPVVKGPVAGEPTKKPG